jgi:hypothetical protein
MIWELFISDFFYYNKLPRTNVIYDLIARLKILVKERFGLDMLWCSNILHAVQFILFEIRKCSMLFKHVNHQFCSKIKLSYYLALNVIGLGLKDCRMNGLNKIIVYFENRSKYSTISKMESLLFVKTCGTCNNHNDLKL